jgi:hypothetical protein
LNEPWCLGGKFGDKSHGNKKDTDEPPRAIEKEEEEKKPSWASVLK